MIRDCHALDELLSRPPAAVVETMGRLEGDLLVLGVGGKMGPSLAAMARRASDSAGVKRRVIGVARFSVPALEVKLQAQGIETVRCDLLDEAALNRLPEVPNVLYLAGMKFGATGRESLTWAMNSYLPCLVCRRFSRSRIVAFSTGNVYGLTSVQAGGSRETDPLAPVGEYAMSCVGRERLFEHFSRALGMPVALIRLNYACDLRYGVLVDIAQKVQAGAPIDLAMSWFNTIWQGDANAMALRCFERAATPPAVVNVTGPEVLNVREVALEFGKRLGRPPVFTGRETDQALLSDASRAFGWFGRPTVSAAELIEWVADWLASGGPTLNKPTHFESRDGRF
ncbi:MAG TPA: NAD-dependent epimerase/dehydratase family protein [Candidatus Paceibacterota bacterium]|nr:NAD-dependent epimerase/dehydratase family protein [Candidatus Paceibacterota bacterium]